MPTTVDEEEYHGALAAVTGNDIDPIMDGSDALNNRSIHGNLTPAEHPRHVVDSGEEVFSPYPGVGSPDQQSPESLSPPPPGQRPRPRTPSPSPSWEYAPMPGAFSATMRKSEFVCTVLNGSIPLIITKQMNWNSSPFQPVEEIKAKEAEDDFYVWGWQDNTWL